MHIRKKRKLGSGPLLSTSTVSQKTEGQDPVKTKQNQQPTIFTPIVPAEKRSKTVPPPAASLPNVKSSVCVLASTLLKCKFNYYKLIVRMGIIECKMLIS